MKKRINITAYPIGIMFFLVFLFLFAVNKTAAQDSSQTATGFPLGAFLSGFPDPVVFNSLDSSGMNTLVWRARDDTKPYLVNYNVIASNGEGPAAGDWIAHYATGFYSKWEAEENQTDPNRVGVKHKYGQDTTWHDTLSWSTIGLSSPVDSLVYGPHYRQAKKYQRWLYNSGPNYRQVYYTARYRMALDYDPELVDPNEEVCRITASVTHALYINGVWTHKVPTDTLAGPITLKVSDFPSNGSFKDFTIERYTYLPKFPGNYLEDKIQIPIPNNDTTYTDSDPMNGIQFSVEWLGVGTLYIDYIDVYDNFGWNDFIEDTTTVVNLIQSNALSYPRSEWPNIKYWFSQDEPYTIDAYTPMRVVDSLVRDVGGAPLITEFYPSWKVFVNGDSQLVKYYEMVKPEKLMIDRYPFVDGYTTECGLTELRKSFQDADSVSKKPVF